MAKSHQLIHEKKNTTRSFVKINKKKKLKKIHSWQCIPPGGN